MSSAFDMCNSEHPLIGLRSTVLGLINMVDDLALHAGPCTVPGVSIVPFGIEGLDRWQPAQVDDWFAVSPVNLEIAQAAANLWEQTIAAGDR